MGVHDGRRSLALPIPLARVQRDHQDGVRDHQPGRGETVGDRGSSALCRRYQGKVEGSPKIQPAFQREVHAGSQEQQCPD